MAGDENGRNSDRTSKLDELLARAYFAETLTLQDLPDLDVSRSSITKPLDGLKNSKFLSDIAYKFGQDKSHTARLQAQYRPIQITIGEENGIDADQPSTSSSLVSSQQESIQDVKIYNRIRELREAGLWDSTRLPKCEDPPRKKTHWDFLLEEVVWMSNDFRNESKTKRLWARKIASNAKALWRKKMESRKEFENITYARDEKEARRVCTSIARMVREFWQNVDKVVDFRANEIVESKKRKALDQHLNFLVGAADKITSIIQERLAESPNSRNSPDANEHVDTYLLEETEMSDGDDESTLDKEEADTDRSNIHVEQELDELYKERDMEIDQLLKTLPAGYLESLDYGTSRSTNDEELGTESSRVDSVDEKQLSAAMAEESENKPDLRNVDYTKLTSDNSEVRRKQLDNIAEAALQFQPRGYTLETTEVKTEVPFLLCGQLREYQLVGLDWLVTLYEKNLNGILADEMGLGKTIQTIALLAHLASARAVWGPHLIIVPTSVLLNWELEFKKWCPSLKILTYFGSAKERAEKRKGWSKANAFHVCITSYKLATQDIRIFKKKAWQYLILDEAQNIKNFRSQRWQLLLGFRSRRRLLLTGTPLQNSLMELWALLHFLMPNVFASHDDFKKWFHSPISGMVEGTTEMDLILVQRLHKVLRPFILRRLKSEVEKQLPIKTEKVIPCSLSKRQRYLYNEFLCRKTTAENLHSGNMLSVLGVIMQLRKCCNHPNLFEPRPVLSPFVAPTIAPQFPQLLFSTNSKMDCFGMDLTLGKAYSSQIAWHILSEISAPNYLSSALKRQPSEPLLPVEHLKFVKDVHGGHFYKKRLPEQNHLLCNGGEKTDEFSESSRKRKRVPSADEQQEWLVPDILSRAIAEFEALGEERDSMNRRLGLWLAEKARSSGPPLLPSEVVASTKLPQLDCSTRTTTSSLLDAVNERIAQNMLDWIKASLGRFLICTRKLLLSGAFPLPSPLLNTPNDEHNFYHLRHLLSTNISSAEQNTCLAHRVEISSKLEFPEMRLIEYDCGKLQVLAKLLAELYQHKHRCLIFTQMSRMLDILQAFLSHHNFKYFRLDGATHIDQRQAMMERFNSDESIFCFILSTRSGGIGVNLTGADTVIFYDSDWNPTMDAQAQDRCHRIGQTRNVTIYRLISERTIEENILSKSMQKRRLGQMAIDEGEFTPEFFKSSNNLRELFSNEETVADIIAPVLSQLQSSKEIEKAMLSVEDQQDAVAAQVAKQETRADSAEFDENIAVNELDNVDNPSEQYLELINSLKPVERYAVNFLANEYRPALDKEFEEAEARIKAKQKEMMGSGGEEEDDGLGVNGEGDEEWSRHSLDLTYDVASPEELPFFAALDLPFEQMPAWMPLSPPNSVEDNECCWPSLGFFPMEGALLYESAQMEEARLPPLPSLISLNEVPPRIRPRQRKALSRTPSSRLSPAQRRPTAPNGTGGRAREGAKTGRAERKEQQRMAEGLPTSALGLLSPPGTPMSAAPEPILQPQMDARREEGILLPAAAAPSTPQTHKHAPAPLSSLDETIESTVRKSRKQASQGPVSRWILRYTGPALQGPEERLAADPARIVFRTVCPEWKNNPALLPTPPAISQPLDYEGPAWTAEEDLRLLRAIGTEHGLSTAQLGQSPGIHLNWEFVSQFLNLGSAHHRSARQCALRYQNNALRCDEPADKAGPSSSSSSVARRHKPTLPPPNSLIFDSNFCALEAATSAKKRAHLMAEIGTQRRHHLDSGASGQPQQPAQASGLPLLLCMYGRIPQAQEQRLLELGARHTSVLRPMDILRARREHAAAQRQKMAKQRQQQQMARESAAGGEQH